MWLYPESDTRLQTFLDLVYEFSQGKDGTLSGFVEHWNVKSEGLSVPAMQDQQAVQIMTIHKSKGLEFPVVIVPHTDLALQDTSRDDAWVEINSNDFLGFRELLVSVKKDLEYYPQPFPDVYQRQINKSQMDQVNLLYVAFTRCREHSIPHS